ncbi:MAG TPA: cysteine desulfurase family protein [Candidatus Saccharimonadales bacterium]|nr:cysteine desulfurase family protein [Candidatus Saccharimonadales bacterium]
MKKSIYLDYAAATPMDPEILKAMEPYFTQDFYNPSATYLAGQAERSALNEARSGVASHLGCRPAEVIFTAGATEANNLAVQGIMRSFPEGEALISSLEHESVLAPAKLFNYQEIPATGQGIVDTLALEEMLNDKTVLVSVMYVNNELGTIQPLREIAELLNKLRKSRLLAGNKTPIYLHTDAAQAGNYLDLHTSRLGVDLMSINGGKLYGPKQSGTLYIKAGVKLQPLIVGGGQEFGLRSGTENVAGDVGLSKALDIAQKMRGQESERVMNLRQQFEQMISEKFPQAVVNGSSKHRAPHIISVTFAGVDNERLMMQLDEAGIICAVGSACSASSAEASHVLSAIGLSPEEARSTLRFSLGRQTTEADIQKTVKVLADFLN